ncbi:MAG: S1 family peptidase [Thermoanaerobaculia bacterium]|nr:S1 family peptidase [Thermoanaerobaculia bacterium]
MPCPTECLDLTKDLDPRLPDPDGKPPKEVRRALEVFDLVFRRGLRQPDVVGVDVGYLIKEATPEFENRIGIRFHVESKLSGQQLRELGRANLDDIDQVKRLFAVIDEIEEDPKSGRITLDGVPIDVVEAQYAPFHLARNTLRSRRPRSAIELEDGALEVTGRKRIEPLVGGVSIGTADGPPGTVGLIVHDRTDGRPCILANWHVLAGFEGSQVGRTCFQPAIFDGGVPGDEVGLLKRWLFDQRGDAALAELAGHRDYSAGSILGLWFPVTDVLQPWLGLEVKKWGRTTGITEGFIDGINMATNIPYGNVTPRHFDGQIHIAARCAGEVFSDRGDSGAVVVADFPTRLRIEEKTKRRESRVSYEILSTLKDRGQPSIDGLADLQNAEELLERWDEERKQLRVYYAVGLLFAGDTAASRFGEFALAHPMIELSESLGFSIQPVFVPESDMVPQVGHSVPRRAPVEGGRPPRPTGPAAGPTTTIGGPQPGTDPSPPDLGP